MLQFTRNRRASGIKATIGKRMRASERRSNKGMASPHSVTLIFAIVLHREGTGTQAHYGPAFGANKLLTAAAMAGSGAGIGGMS
jgi:hypothetical protein